jgi:hypothetical protein
MQDAKTRHIALSEDAQEELQRTRLEYAERCDNLSEVMKMQANLLREAVPVDASPERRAIIGALPQSMTVEIAENLFARIDAAWAAWNRPGLASNRNAESVARHVRRVFLAALDAAARFLDLQRAARAGARQKLGGELNDEDRAVLAGPDADLAREFIEGRPVLLETVYGIQMVAPDASIEQMAKGRETDEAGLVRFLFAQNGYPRQAGRLTANAATAALDAWRNAKPGRPRNGESYEPKWDLLVEIIEGLDAYPNEGSDKPDKQRQKRKEALRKDWEAFVRERGTASKVTSRT